MSIRYLVSPALDGGPTDFGGGEVRLRSIRIEAGDYATPFWLRYDTGAVDYVTTLPFYAVRMMGAVEVLSEDPNVGLGTISDLSATSGDTQVALSWTPAANATSHQPQYKESSSGTWLDFGSALGGSATSVTVTGLTNDTTYDFRVVAGDGSTTTNSNTASATAGLITASAFIIGPQVALGLSPWDFFDDNVEAKAQTHRDATLASVGDDQLNANYYDMALGFYTLADRSNSSVYLGYARDIAQWWWEGMPARVNWETYKDPFAISPRNSSLGGLMLYIAEGSGTVPLTFEVGDQGGTVDYTALEWVTEYVRQGWDIWLGSRLTYPGLYYGVRDGGYMLLYAAWLAKLHPDAAVRAEMLDKALQAARDYYARLQYADGGWYWEDDGSETKPDGVWEQPFMVGLLLEGMRATHELTGNTAVRAAILASVDHLYAFYRFDTVPSMPSVQWRSVPYFVYTDGTWSGETDLEGGTDTNTIREGRQRNSLIIHAFGYAYHLTGDTKYQGWGDEVFASTYGKGQGPLADAYYNLADYRAKEYNQSYRSAGRYLGGGY